MDRRSVIRGIVAAPAIVAAASLVPMNARMLVPRLVGDGIADDTDALHYLLNSGGTVDMTGKICRVTRPIVVTRSYLHIPYLHVLADHVGTALQFGSCRHNRFDELIVSRAQPSLGYPIEFKS